MFHAFNFWSDRSLCASGSNLGGLKWREHRSENVETFLWFICLKKNVLSPPELTFLYKCIISIEILMCLPQIQGRHSLCLRWHVEGLKDNGSLNNFKDKDFKLRPCVNTNLSCKHRYASLHHLCCLITRPRFTKPSEATARSAPLDD